MTKKQILKDNVSSINEFKKKTFVDLIIESFCTIKPSNRRSIIIILIVLSVIHPIESCIKSNNTLNSIKEIVGMTNGIIMAMFAILFTGYALFQALINRNSLKVLFLGKSKNNRILFLEYNLYFFAVCILYVALISINYIVSFLITTIGASGINSEIDENLRTVALRFFAYVYLYINLFAITEIKSFIYNLFQCFNISAMSTMIEAMRSYDDDLHEK